MLLHWPHHKLSFCISIFFFFTLFFNYFHAKCVYYMAKREADLSELLHHECRH